MQEPEWTEEAWEGLLDLLAYIERTPRGKPELRAAELFAAIEGLPASWERYPVRYRAGHVELRRLVTERDSLVVFSHEDEVDDPDGVIVVRWVAHAHAEQRRPSEEGVRPRGEILRIRPGR